MALNTNQIEGITKARITCNLTRDADNQFADNDAYVAWVCEMAGIKELPDYAADSYASQWADKETAALEAELAEKADNPPDVT